MTHARPHQGHPDDAHGDEYKDEGITAESLAAIADVGQLEGLYGEALDAEEQSLVVLRLLQVDARSGARLAIEFLRGDPPLLFSMMVVDGIEGVAGHSVGYDVEKPFSAPSNQGAVFGLEEEMGLK